MMLRAATAASGGTGAPDWTYGLDLALDVAHQGLDLEARWLVVLEEGDLRADERLDLREALDAQALLALHDGAHGPVLELHHLGDLGQGADLVELGRVGDVFLFRPAAA